MQLRQSSPDAVASFSDFLLERFGLVASMQAAFVVSVALHTFVIIGLGFQVVDWRGMAAPHNVMDVVLVNAKSATRPDKPDALAQANLDGGGNTDEKRRASTPFPVIDQREITQDLQQAKKQVQLLERESKQLMTRLKSQAQVAPLEVPTPGAKSEADAQDLVSKRLEIERLEAQIRREFQAYQERPKKRYIGARAGEYRFAQYVDNWRVKVERIGTLNYPAEAKAKRIYGSLQLTVGIKADGEVESIEINRSSRSKLLDDAAVRTVRLAAPFERFPDAIRTDTDILYITRTWTFTRGDQVLAE